MGAGTTREVERRDGEGGGEDCVLSLCEGAEGAWSRSGRARRPRARDPLVWGLTKVGLRKAVIELGLTVQSSNNRSWRKLGC